MVPVVAAVYFMPPIMAVGLVMIPPIVAMERQSHAREVNPGIGAPAIAEAVAHHVGGGIGCAAGDAGQRQRRSKQSIFQVFHRRSPFCRTGGSAAVDRDLLGFALRVRALLNRYGQYTLVERR